MLHILLCGTVGCSAILWQQKAVFRKAFQGASSGRSCNAASHQLLAATMPLHPLAEIFFFYLNYINENYTFR
ncbi:MAG: hypothetical protein AUJ98_01170 [Bacteroidetes bacterium CG2_30_33_31]|nr:MAG: hypothetical protein AUJ98_01170 [Bacteroidetes bacterium CG2_30_33_31]